MYIFTNLDKYTIKYLTLWVLVYPNLNFRMQKKFKFSNMFNIQYYGDCKEKVVSRPGYNSTSYFHRYRGIDNDNTSLFFLKLPLFLFIYNWKFFSFDRRLFDLKSFKFLFKYFNILTRNMQQNGHFIFLMI